MTDKSEACVSSTMCFFTLFYFFVASPCQGLATVKYSSVEGYAIYTIITVWLEFANDVSVGLHYLGDVPLTDTIPAQPKNLDVLWILLNSEDLGL
jgi:hypothetical protein